MGEGLSDAVVTLVGSPAHRSARGGVRRRSILNAIHPIGILVSLARLPAGAHPAATALARLVAVASRLHSGALVTRTLCLAARHRAVGQVLHLLALSGRAGTQMPHKRIPTPSARSTAEGRWGRTCARRWSRRDTDTCTPRCLPRISLRPASSIGMNRYSSRPRTCRPRCSFRQKPAWQHVHTCRRGDSARSSMTKTSLALARARALACPSGVDEAGDAARRAHVLRAH